MAVSGEFQRYVLEQLHGVGTVTARRMGRLRPFADTLEDAAECVLWARRSVAIAAAPTPPMRYSRP